MSSSRALRLFLTIFCVIAVSAGAAAQPIMVRTVVHAPPEYAGAIEQGRSLVQWLMVEQSVPGLTVAVIADGEMVWSEGFGYADLENRVPAWPHTKMRIGSVSKSLTAAALGLLIEQGLLDLDVPVQQYVPSFPDKQYPITTRQVAGHLAGIRHYAGDEFLLSRRYPTVSEGLTIFQDDPLLHEPGTKYHYSSYGWNLVSAAIEGASGEDYLSYMGANVFRPLGLRHTVADHNDSLVYTRTRFYERNAQGLLLNAPYVDNSYKWAGGGFLSTAEDLVQFGNGLLTGRLLERETLERLFASQSTLDGILTGYGIGFASGVDDAGRRYSGHGGGSVGGTTQFVMYPDEGVVVAMISNLGSVNFGDVHRKIAGLFLDGPAEARN